MSMRQRRRASSEKGEDRIPLSKSSSTTSNSRSENGKVGVKPKQYSAPPSAPQTSTENPSKVDVFLSNYCEHTSCTYFVDIGIKILVYTLWAISYITRTSHDPLVENNVFSSSLRYLSIEIQMARYVLRFFGSLEALEGFRSGSWAGGTWDNPRIAMIAKYFLAGSMLIFYPLDHIAYFGWMVPDLVKVDAERYYSYSCWCWLVYLVADIFVSRLKSAELKKKIMDLEKLLLGRKKKNDDDDERNEEAMVSIIFLLCLMTSLFLDGCFHKMNRGPFLWRKTLSRININEFSLITPILPQNNTHKNNRMSSKKNKYYYTRNCLLLGCKRCAQLWPCSLH